MNFFCKAIGYCLIIAMAYPSQAQCVFGKKVETFSGDTLIYLCPDGRPDVLSFKPFTFATPFLFVITTKQDTIVRVSTSGSLDFNELEGTEFRVYGYSYKGSIKKVTGQHLSTAKITDFCYAKSTNFITVIKEYPLPPSISNTGSQPSFICAPDSKPDSIRMEANFPSRNKVKYLVVNENNKIVFTSDKPVFDADPLNCKTCKSYALSYTGNFNAVIGTDISAPLASDCYVLSSNFISFTRDLPKGGSIQFTNGTNNQFICSSSTKNQNLSLQLSNSSAGYHKYVFTDTLNKVLAVSDSSTIPVAALGAGTCRIWGLTFTGQFASNYTGLDVKTLSWSNDCYAVTDNFLAVTKALPDGGTIRFTNLTDSQFVCKNDIQDRITLGSSNSKGQSFVSVITDQSGVVQAWTDSSFFDFNSLPSGQWRLYNLAYTGQLTLTKGKNLSEAPSDDCYDYSNAFLTVFVDVPNAGNLVFSDQATEKFYCATDTGALNVQLNWAGFSLLPSVLVLTDSSDRFIKTFTGSTLDISKQKNGSYRIYGLSYTGQLNFTADSVIDRLHLSSGCAQISAQPIKFIKEEAKAGAISLENGNDTLRLCTTQSVVSIRFKSINSHISPFTYILTNDRDSVIRILKTDTLHLSNPQKGISKIWGLAYTGQLLINPGGLLTQNPLASGCADLSSNTIILIKDEPDGGRISLSSGDTVYTICSKDGWADRLSLKTSSHTLLDYQYVLTDGDGKIMSFHAEQLDIENLPAGPKKVYGVNYLGSVTAKIGDDITQVNFAADCYKVSSNFIQIGSDELSGGTIKNNRNALVLNYCLDEAVADTVFLSNNGSTAGAKYIYIGIQSDTLKYISSTGWLINNQLPKGTLQVFGVAFRGSFTAKVGDKVSAARIADSCYNVSSNSIVIQKDNPEAGSVSAGGGIKEFYLCPKDGQSDFISILPQGESKLSYAYVITSATDSILGWSLEPSFDLDTFGLGFCKIYGLSYKGTLQLAGKFINSASLTSHCYDVSSDFISVYKANAEAGRLSLANGDTVTTICVEDLAQDTLLFKNSGVAGLKYALLVTDNNNRLQTIIEQTGKAFDFNGADPGVSRIYGVSYGGILTVFRNEDVTKAKLSSGCYDLTSNFVTLNKINSGSTCKTSGVNESNPAFLSIFPNPAKQEVFLQLRKKHIQGGKPSLSVISAAGGFQQKINLAPTATDNEQVRIDVSDLTPGIYFIIFKNGYIFDRVKLVVAK